MAKGGGGAGRGGGASSGAVAGAPGSGAQSSAPLSVAADVTQAVESFNIGARVEIADVLNLVDSDLNAAKLQLRQMQRDGRVVLMAKDDPQDITPRDRRAAIDVGDNDPRMIIYRVR